MCSIRQGMFDELTQLNCEAHLDWKSRPVHLSLDAGP